MRAYFVFALALLLGLVVDAAPIPARRSNALWHVVHGLCVMDARLTGLPAPCLAVSRRGGYAVLKDIRGRTQILLIPTARITGIESPALLAKGAPNYWQMAWRSRAFFEHAAGEAAPRQDIGMAINSDFGRTQDQLHIHIDCVRMGVMSALADHEAEIGPSWAPFPVKLAGERYKARRISGEDLRGADPFKLLAEIPAARADMGAWTLAVIGARFADGSPGFWLLAAQAGVPANPRGASESLLDHDCAVLHDPVG